MEYKFVKEFMESVFHKELWIFEIIFCLIAPAFLFVFLISKDIFSSMELIKLFLLCVIGNGVLFYLLFTYRYSLVKERIVKLKEINSRMEKYDDILFDYEQSAKEVEYDIDLAKHAIECFNARESDIKLADISIEHLSEVEHIESMKNSIDDMSEVLFENVIKLSKASKSMEFTKDSQERLRRDVEKLRNESIIEIMKNVFKKTIFICLVIITFIIQKYIFNINLGNRSYTILIISTVLIVIIVDFLSNIKKPSKKIK